MPENVSATQFIENLTALLPPKELAQFQVSSKVGDTQSIENKTDKFEEVRMGQLFALAKEFIGMPPDQIEILLENPNHNVRVGALSIMDKQARRKKTPESRREALFNLYIGHPEKIDNWDLVDLGCLYVVGGYLFDKPHDILYKLARSKDTWERRTAIVSTLFFVRQNQVEDTFKIAEILVNDDQDLIHKAVGGLLREAGKKDRLKLIDFLDRYAATMPRVMLRYAIEHLDDTQRDHYLYLKRSKSNVKQ